MRSQRGTAGARARVFGAACRWIRGSGLNCGGDISVGVCGAAMSPVTTSDGRVVYVTLNLALHITYIGA